MSDLFCQYFLSCEVCHILALQCLSIYTRVAFLMQLHIINLSSIGPFLVLQFFVFELIHFPVLFLGFTPIIIIGPLPVSQAGLIIIPSAYVCWIVNLLWCGCLLICTCLIPDMIMPFHFKLLQILNSILIN